MRYFNTAGPCVPSLHYMLPALARLPEAEQLVRRHAYFAVHAPPSDRQDHLPGLPGQGAVRQR